MRFRVWSYRFREFAISFYNVSCHHQKDHLWNACKNTFHSDTSGSAASFTALRLFFLYELIGSKAKTSRTNLLTSGASITWRHFMQKWLSFGYRFGYRSILCKFQKKLQNINACKAHRTSDNIRFDWHLKLTMRKHTVKSLRDREITSCNFMLPTMHFMQFFHKCTNSQVIVFGSSLYRFTGQDAHVCKLNRSNM